MNLEHWKFGGNNKESDYLFFLVMNGVKTATSSLKRNNDLPKVGERSYIINSFGNSKILIELTNVSVKKFSEIDSDFARKEGEGDLSLSYWQDTHKQFFENELKNKGLEFNEDVLLVCEEFKVINTFSLKTPLLKDLQYRQDLLSDPDTMGYNSGYELGLDNYNYETGCIDFDKSRWNDWYERKVNCPRAYYSYVYSDEIPVGEVFCSESGEVSIIVESKHRSKGYAKQALDLLIPILFENFEYKTLSDNIPEYRKGAVALFKSYGFKVKDTDKTLRFGKEEIGLLLELKKEEYNENI